MPLSFYSLSLSLSALIQRLADPFLFILPAPLSNPLAPFRLPPDRALLPTAYHDHLLHQTIAPATFHIPFFCSPTPRPLSGSPFQSRACDLKHERKIATAQKKDRTARAQQTQHAQKRTPRSQSFTRAVSPVRKLARPHRVCAFSHHQPCRAHLRSCARTPSPRPNTKTTRSRRAAAAAA